MPPSHVSLSDSSSTWSALWRPLVVGSRYNSVSQARDSIPFCAFDSTKFRTGYCIYLYVNILCLKCYFIIEICLSKLQCWVLGDVMKISCNYIEILIDECVKTFSFQTWSARPASVTCSSTPTLWSCWRPIALMACSTWSLNCKFLITSWN